MILFVSTLSDHSLRNFSQVTVAKASSPPPWTPWNVSGEQKLVAICTEFSDVIHTVDSQTIKNRLNNITKYFSDISFGRICLNITFYGDHWERLNNTMAYYGNGSYNQDNRGYQFIEDSVKAWDRYVNFSNYDHLLVIHAGEDQSSNENDTELLWRQGYYGFGHSGKVSVMGTFASYSFWGKSYDSEFEEWGLIAHEIGHDLGLPDLYFENETLSYYPLSLMAGGDRNGNPSGTIPSSLDGFSMYLLGLIIPEQICLNSTKDIFTMTARGLDSATLLKIPLTESQYYLLEIREKAGYDSAAVDSPSLVFWHVDEMRPSKNGTAVVGNNGIVTEGKIYSDTATSIYFKFISFNQTSHIAKVALSTEMFFVILDLPESVQVFSPTKGTIKVYDLNNNPVGDFNVNVSIGNKQIQVITNSNGEANLDLGTLEEGLNIIQVHSPHLLFGETQETIKVFFPWDYVILSVIAFLVGVVVSMLFVKR